jgi:hypothetical protein
VTFGGKPDALWIGVVGFLLAVGWLTARALRMPLDLKCEQYLAEEAERELRATDDPPVTGIGYSACSATADDIIGVQCFKDSIGASEMWVRCTRWGCARVDIFDFGKYRVPAPVCNKPWAMAVIERRR